MRSSALSALRCASLPDTPIPPGFLSQRGRSGSRSPGLWFRCCRGTVEATVRGSQMDLSAGLGMSTALSLPSPDRSSASHQGWEARTAVSSAPIEAQTRQLSYSEKLDVVSVNARDTEDSPPQSCTYEKLVEVVTRAVDWPAEKENVRSKKLNKNKNSRKDEHFLPSRTQPQCRGLTFFFLISTPRCRDHGRNRFPIDVIVHKHLTIPLNK